MFHKKLITLTTAALLTVGAVCAAAAPGMGHGRRLQQLTASLGLTDQQQAQAKAIFSDSFASAKPIRQQLRQER